MSEDRSIISYLDRVLVVAGIAGAIVYTFLLPTIHPDAAPNISLNREEVIKQAVDFTRLRGYDASSMTWQAFLRRQPALLDTLGEKLGAATLFDGIQDGSLDDLPLYYWHVVGRPENRSTEEAPAPYTLDLTADGTPWAFHPPEDQLPSSDTEALRHAIENTPDFFLFGRPLTVDSLIQRESFFRLPPTRRGPPRDRSPQDSVAGRPEIEEARPSPEPVEVALSDAAARAIAQYHVQNTLLSRYNLTIDTVFRPIDFDGDQVRVQFSTPELALVGLPFHVNVDVFSSGVLAGIEPEFRAAEPITEETQGNQFSFDFSMEELPAYLLILSYIALGILTLTLFIRRLSARLIDVKSAIQDAIWGAIFLGGMAANQMGWNILNETASFWNGLLLGGIFSLISTSLAAFLVFMVSCGTDSISRFIWPEKVVTLSMSRNLLFRNVSMGRAFIHGLCLAGMLLGVQSVLLLLPGISLSFDESLSAFPPENAFSALGKATFSNGGYSMLCGMTVLLGMGALFYSKRRSKFTALGGITLFFMLLQLGPVEITSSYVQWIFSGALGLIIAIAFLRFDYLTAFLGLFFSGAVWDLSPGWLLPASGMLLDAWIAIALLAGCLVLGFIGLHSRTNNNESEQFKPAYLKEIAQQERLKSELDIATQVQASLLPHRMPEMAKLDIAAMCLPAQEVGGDYFDFIQLDDYRLALVVGDVSGKGIQAAFYMTLTKGFIHAICRDEHSPARLLTRVNHLFCENAPRGTFISLIYGIFDTRADTFTFARAGHDPVIIRHSGAAPEFVKPSGIAIGLTASKTFETNIDDQVIDFSSGDLIVLYTDGVTEAVNPYREQFGANRLFNLVKEMAAARSSMILQNLSQRLQVFVQSAGRHDDMTLIVVRGTQVASRGASAPNPKSQSNPLHE